MSYDFAAIRSRHKLSDVVGRVVKLTREGNEHRGLCPFHDEKTPSFTVVDAKQFFYCFGCGARGDVIDFVQCVHGHKDVKQTIDMLEGSTPWRDPGRPKREAAYDEDRTAVAREPGTPPNNSPPPAGEKLRAYNAKRGSWVTYQPSAVYPYWNADATLNGIVIRLELPGRKKITPMLRWLKVSKTQSGWTTGSFERPRRPYVVRPAELKSEQIIVVEGEKCADAAAAALGITAVAWAGGVRGAHLTDWSMLKGRSIVLWPDADSEGVGAMLAMFKLAQAAKAKKIKLLSWDKSKPKGWDVADAVAEGWPADKILAWMRDHAIVAPSTDAADDNTVATTSGPGASIPPAADRSRAIAEAPVAEGVPGDNPSAEPHESQHTDQFPFRILGHDEGRYYYFPNGSKQVIKLSASAHSPANLLSLYPNVAWWEMNFPNKGKGFDVNAATAALMSYAHRVGIFDDSKVRGRGAWQDNGKALIHLGDVAIVDGEVKPLTEIKSRFIYSQRSRIDLDILPPATTKQAHRLVKICNAPTWTTPLSGNLLCGWIITSMVCGALKWRPHIWITGGAGSGKTTVVNEIVMNMIGPLVERCDGTITEAGIRHHMLHDARPVLIDEFESESRQDSDRVQGVLKLARLSSSGSSLKRGSMTGEGVEYIVRSSFCLSSINTAASERADQSRISSLILVKNTAPDAEEHYANLLRMIAETLTPEYAAAMLSRTIANLPTLLSNITMFEKAAAITLNDRRAADQIAAMLAGYFLCHSTRLITLEEATQWVRRRAWGDHTAIEAASDEVRLLVRIALITQRMNLPHGTKDFTIGELIQIAAHRREASILSSDAHTTLGRLGIKADPGDSHFIIANQSPALKRYLTGTPWEHNWIRPLRSIEGAQAVDKTYFSPAFKERGTAIPMSLLDESIPVVAQPTLDEEYDGCSDDMEIPA